MKSLICFIGLHDESVLGCGLHYYCRICKKREPVAWWFGGQPDYSQGEKE